MALEVQIKALRLPGSRRARIEFRGVRYYTRALRGDESGNVYSTDEVFEWLLASPLDKAERIMIQIQRGWPHRQAWHVPIPLSSSLRSPSDRICITQHLLDDRERPLQATITLEIMYTSPENSAAFLGPDDEDYQASEDERQSDDARSEDEPLLDIKRNIMRLEKGLALREPLAPNYPPKESPPTTVRSKRISTLRSVKNIMRLGKRRPSNGSSTDEESRFLMSPLQTVDNNGEPIPSTSRANGNEDVMINIDHDQDDQHIEVFSNTISPTQDQNICISHIIDVDETDKTEETGAAAEPTASVSPPGSQIRKPIPNMHTASQSHLKAQDFQVCLTILEARHLAGLNMDPVVCIQVGEHKKYTSVKESTNCPYYNEYFVFDFHIPPVMLFDKIINLSVLQARNVLRSYKLLGSFKLDVATVWTQPDHQFYHKWAVLSDPSDPMSGPKGYLKCDISVIGKGDMVKVPPKSQKDEDDIEANLLLPDGVSTERQRAKYIVYIHKADGLPKMNLSIMANVKKALTGEDKDLVDPFVQVCFAGLTGSTSVKRNTYNPVWNERVIFSDMFPPLCQRIRIQLRDQDPVKPTVIGTHYIDLKAISNDGERSKGFLPTFGPAYVYLYGSPRDYTLLDQHSALNAGLGEGVSYRARVLISIRTELTDNPELMPSAVDVEPCIVPNEACCLKEDDFLLFGALLDVSMIDKKLAEKTVSFELSIGNAGNTLDGQNQSSRMNSDLPYDLERGQSTTRPMKAMSHDKEHYFLPLWDTKLCVHVSSKWPDQTRRMYISNMLEKIVDNYDEGLKNIGELHGDEALKQLRESLNNLHLACRHFVERRQLSHSTSTESLSELDKRRSELLLRELDSIATKSRHLKAIVTKSSFKERLKSSQVFLTKLKSLVEDPQGTLPDIVIWAIGGGKRFAYQRVPARHLIYSPVEEEMGKLCGKTHTMFLRLPGKKAEGASGWTIPTKVTINLWLGLSKHKMHYIDGLPEGYEMCSEIKNHDKLEIPPPSSLNYMQQNIFQLRAYIYQARSLIGSDASGLSDPFAKVIAGEHCKTTRVIDETLSPTWDQTLILDEITIFGSLKQIKEDPLTIIIEIFDRDKVGKAEFIGRAMAKPRVKTLNDSYNKPLFPPCLEWYEITRGLDHAGELLATFELLQTNRGDAGELLPPPDVPELFAPQDIDYIPVPNQIRPTLAKYRIEILFWGLRNLRRVHFLKVDKPRVDIECAGNILSSSIIQNANKNPNFSAAVKFLDVELPEQELYRPPLTIRVVDCRSFGRFTLVGTHMINSIHDYMFNPQTMYERENSRKKSLNKNDSNRSDENDPQKFGYTIVETKIQYADEKEKSPLLFRELPFNHGYGTSLFGKKKVVIDERSRKRSPSHEFDDDDEDSKDWWTKYFASVDQMIEETKNEKLHKNKKTDSISGCSDAENYNPPVENKEAQFINERKRKGKAPVPSKVIKLSPTYDRKKTIPISSMFKVYTNELETQLEFEEFKDWLLSFDLYRGKKTGDESEDESRNVGTFKGAIKVYKWPMTKIQDEKVFLGFDPQYGFFQNMPSNDPIRVLVRIYVVKAIDLHPMDLNGKADPYILINLGSKTVNDKENYISKQLNPVFGKCFELEATFPLESILTVKIQDWDLVGTDDVIGETKIDLENRFYSKHRATCGLSRTYEEQGFNRWRDTMKPTQILAKLCKDSKIDPPVYEGSRIRIGGRFFDLNDEMMEPLDYDGRNKIFEERLALSVLHRWQEVPRAGCHLVVEHIETRPLFHPNKPGIERGKLEMWVDMFPLDSPPPGPPVDISPRKPRAYELRIIIWNTDDVVLEDDAFFTGEKMSDIYVKGWLKGPEDCQSTDIHYRSLTGEGNFNWRFIFPFDYLVAEEKIVITKKESLFSWDESQSKIPARLEFQVWDADHFSADDFLGAITLDLNRFPRGAKSSKLCTLEMLKADGSVPMINIFKQKRVKGWWPFYIKKDNEEMELTGKVEAEIHLLTKEEAEKNPAGLGRNEPEPLEKPNRPDASFMWFLNPLKSLRYIIWHNYKWKVLKISIILLFFFMILLFFYAIPGYTVKRLIGA